MHLALNVLLGILISCCFNNYRSYDGESWQVWEQFVDTAIAEEPVCTEVKYRVSFTHDGETHSKESDPVRFELDATMDLETIAEFSMKRSDEGNMVDMLEVTWTDIPCIGNYSVKVCSTDGECEETQVIIIIIIIVFILAMIIN